MIRYQGESINFALEIEKILPTDVSDWSLFTSVIVYFYTHENYIVKFNTAGGAGIDGILTLESRKEKYTGVLEAEYTKQMYGPLYMDIYLYKADENYKCIRKVNTGVNIKYAPIKQEA